MTDNYKVLGVSPQADDKQIKAAYRKLAKQYHPDAVRDNPELTAKMYDVQAAYEVLGDAQKRKKYDEQLEKAQSGKAKKRSQGNGQQPDPNMTEFERFFGFQAGKGMDSYRDNRSGAKKAEGPVNPEHLFASFFGKQKR